MLDHVELKNVESRYGSGGRKGLTVEGFNVKEKR